MSIVSNENKEMLWDLIIDICNDNGFKVNGEELKSFLDMKFVLKRICSHTYYQLLLLNNF